MKILLAIDPSDASQKAVDFVARLAGGRDDVAVTLFHAVEALPDYLLMPAVAQRWKDVAREWETHCHEEGETLLENTRERLVEAGLPAEAVTTRLVTRDALPEARKVVAAAAIIEEMKSGGYDVVCVGRRGASPADSVFPGSVAAKVLREAAGNTVWVVD